MGGCTDEQTDGWMDGLLGGQTDIWVDGRTDEQTDGWTDGRTDTDFCASLFTIMLTDSVLLRL